MSTGLSVIVADSRRGELAAGVDRRGLGFFLQNIPRISTKRATYRAIVRVWGDVQRCVRGNGGVAFFLYDPCSEVRLA